MSSDAFAPGSPVRRASSRASPSSSSLSSRRPAGMASISSKRVQLRQNSLVIEGMIARALATSVRMSSTSRRDPDGVVVPGRLAGLAFPPGLVRSIFARTSSTRLRASRVAVAVRIEDAIAVRRDDLVRQFDGGGRSRTGPLGRTFRAGGWSSRRILNSTGEFPPRGSRRESDSPGRRPRARNSPCGTLLQPEESVGTGHGRGQGAGLPQFSTVAAATGRPSVSMTRPVIVRSGVTRIGLKCHGVRAGGVIHSLPARV